jgi:hypothetical protein
MQKILRHHLIKILKSFLQDYIRSTINFKIDTVKDEEEELSKEKFYHIPGLIFIILLFL